MLGLQLHQSKPNREYKSTDKPMESITSEQINKTNPLKRFLLLYQIKVYYTLGKKFRSTVHLGNLLNI